MTRILTLMSLVALLLAPATTFAQFPEPSPEHKIVQRDVGKWEATIKIWMGENGTADASAEPQISVGTEANHKLGEFWVISNFKGEFGGMPFEGHAVNGYDPIKKQFVGSWTDSMSPNAMHMAGTYDEKTKTMTYSTKGIGMDGKEANGKATVLYGEKNTRTMTMYEMVNGKEVKSMEIVYKRAAPAK